MPVSHSVDPRHPATHLRILGPLRVRRGDAEVDVGPPQQRCLLALLLARTGHPVGTPELVDLLWGPDAPPSAVNTIHKYVGGLRRLLEPGLPPRAPGTYLTRHGNGYRFTAGPEALDLALFRRTVAEAKAYARGGEPDAALDRYAAALRLGHGPAGDGLAGTPAARSTFARLDGEFTDAVLDAAGIAIRLRRPAPVLASLRRAAERDPFDERVQAGLVTTLAAAGRQAEALAAYRSIRARLADELGIDPGPDLREAHRRVLTQAGPPPRRTGRAVARRRRWLRPSRRSAGPVGQAAEFTLNVMPEYERAESKTFDSGE
ncbi:AfsR/SARP family transcriptional regulator [Micromonospora haikouensis]|uniref:AfsR/SARP family transcriptional regulator n=1 Tax=Micromonospora haikouensis TaxID=686309 RepID=UPI003D7527AE